MKLSSESLLVTCAVKTSLKDLEGWLRRQGYSLGYHPTKKIRTLEQALKERTPNQYALRYGEIDDICVSLQVTRKRATIVTRNVPRSATGPDFKRLFIGSGKTYGEPIAATLRVVPLLQKAGSFTISWKKPEDLKEFYRLLDASGIRPVQLNPRGALSLLVEIGGSLDIFLAEKECLRRLARQTKGRLP